MPTPHSRHRSAGEPDALPLNLPPQLAHHPRYRILRELGRGGMGVVYQAHQTLMNRPVVIKVINRALLDRPDAVERFRREVEAAARLSHPNIVAAYDAEQAGGLHMLVMEFVPGQSLAEVLKKKGPLTVAHACHFARQAALGLQHAHDQGMVHRDIKPQNLMLTPKGQVKILDFGLAKLASERGADKGLTSTGACMGTPDYCAPEQATDAHSADIRADLYSLGCTLYCLLAGRPPFGGESTVKTLLAHQAQAPRPLPELRPDVPAALWQVVARLLAKDPAQRYRTPAEVARALLPFIKPGEAGVGKPPSVPDADQTLPGPGAVPHENPFADLGTTEVTPRGPAEIPRPKKSGWERPRWFLPAAAGGLAFLLVVLTVFLTRRAAPTKQSRPEVTSPTVAAPQAKPPGNRTPEAHNDSLPPAAPPAPPEGRDRAAMAWVRSIGGEGEVFVGESFVPGMKAVPVTKDSPVPSGPIMVSGIKLAANPQVTTKALEEHLRGLYCLNWLDIPDNGARVTDLSFLDGLSSLTSLNVSGDFLTENCLEHLRDKKILQGLGIGCKEQTTNVRLGYLKGLPALRRLNLDNLRWTDQVRAELAALKQLSDLTLATMPVTDADLAELLPSLPELRYLGLFGTRITDGGLRYISRLGKLECLSLHGTPVTEAGLKNLASLSDFSSLEYGWTQPAQPEGLRGLTALGKLQRLTLREMKLSDQDMKVLGSLKDLRYLDLGGCDLDGEASLKHLTDMPQLRELNLGSYPRTNKGVPVSDKAVPILARFSQLERLNLKDTGMTAKGRQQLQEALPKCRIEP